MGNGPAERRWARIGRLPPAAAHLFVADVAAPVLHDDDIHHVERVLRLRPGEEVTVADGRGNWRRCRLAGSHQLEVIGPPEYHEAPAPAVTIGFALTKGERPEWVVQKLTEVGVDRIVAFTAARTVVRWDPAKAARRMVRLRAVARAAAMQCRRTWLPVVEELASFEAAVAAAGSAGALAHPGGQPVDLDRPAVLIGPEGGFAPPELACGLPLVDLGPTVLRAETAAMACGFLLCALRATGIGGPGRAHP
jgi:16S rRNA (uracil1498-N3)-methyltransferase